MRTVGHPDYLQCNARYACDECEQLIETGVETGGIVVACLVDDSECEIIGINVIVFKQLRCACCPNTFHQIIRRYKYGVIRNRRGISKSSRNHLAASFMLSHGLFHAKTAARWMDTQITTDFLYDIGANDMLE